MSEQKDREKILDTLVRACSWFDDCKLHCTPADHENCYGYLVSVIKPLIEEARHEGRGIFEGKLSIHIVHKDNLVDVGEWAECQDVGVFVYFPDDTYWQALKQKHLGG